MTKPPPPPRPQNRPNRQTIAELNQSISSDEQAKDRNYALPLLFAGVAILCLMLLICVGGVGAVVAYRASQGGGGGQGDGGADGGGAGEGDVGGGSGSLDGGGESSGAGEQASDGQSEADSANDAGNGAKPPAKKGTQKESVPPSNSGAGAQQGSEQESGGESEAGSGDSSAGQAGSGNTGAASGPANIPGATFFGISSTAQQIVYVVDCSGSMEGDRFVKAKAELIRSIRSLLVSQKYFIIFFDEGEYPMHHPNYSSSLLEGSDENLNVTEQWITSFPIGSGTDPTKAMERAISFRPETIFLLTDGEFEDHMVDGIRQRNAGRSKINTISFMSQDGEPQLKKIAAQNGGVYRYVP